MRESHPPYRLVEGDEQVVIRQAEEYFAMLHRQHSELEERDARAFLAIFAFGFVCIGFAIVGVVATARIITDVVRATGGFR